VKPGNTGDICDIVERKALAEMALDEPKCFLGGIHAMFVEATTLSKRRRAYRIAIAAV